MAPRVLAREPRPDEDHFVYLRDVSWADYRRLLAIRGEHSAPRISYLEGDVEIMSPSRGHEGKKDAQKKKPKLDHERKIKIRKDNVGG